jgi:hypothetical protein
MRGFWNLTLPSAMTHPFQGSESPVANDLAALEDLVAGTANA